MDRSLGECGLNTIAGTRTDPGGHLTEARTGAHEARQPLR